MMGFNKDQVLMTVISLTVPTPTHTLYLIGGGHMSYLVPQHLTKDLKQLPLVVDLQYVSLLFISQICKQNKNNLLA